MPLNNTSSPNYINNNKINKQSNEFDVLLSHDMYLNNELRNDVQNNELRSDSKMKRHSPTPVTIANVIGGKKKRELKYKNLRVLIDTGCSHSIMHQKYTGSNKLNKRPKLYSTGSGVLKTKYETTEKLMLTEFSDKKISHGASVFLKTVK